MKDCLSRSELIANDAPTRYPDMRGIFIAIVLAETLVIAIIFVIMTLGTVAQANDDMSNTRFMGGMPLNETWLGMKVMTIDGQAVGHIHNAIVDADGGVQTVSIQPHGDSALVEAKMIAASFVMLADSHVIADMTLNTLTAQTSTETYWARQNQ